MAIQKILKDNLVKMFAEFKYAFKDMQSQTEMGIISTYFSTLSEEQVLQHCQAHLLPYKTLALKQDEDLIYKQKNEIFKGLPQARIDHYARSWLEGGIDKAYKDTAWKYLIVIVKLTEKATKRT